MKVDVHFRLFDTKTSTFEQTLYKSTSKSLGLTGWSYTEKKLLSHMRTARRAEHRKRIGGDDDEGVSRHRQDRGDGVDGENEITHRDHLYVR